MRNHLLAAAIAGTVLSCSLFTSLGGYSADADEPLPDGGGTGDGTTANGDDSGKGDAGDASLDAGRFCETTDATLCEDFDDPIDAAFKQWTGTNIDNGGVVTRTDAGYSVPNALSALAPAQGTSQVSALLERNFAAAKRARVAYRFRLDLYENEAVVNLGQLIMTTGSAISSVRMTIVGGAAHFEGAVYPTGNGGPGTFPDLTSLFQFADTSWHTVDMTVDWAPSPAVVTIVFDEMRIADNVPLAGSTFGAGSLRITAGVYYRKSGSTPWRVFVDDFSAWVE